MIRKLFKSKKHKKRKKQNRSYLNLKKNPVSSIKTIRIVRFIDLSQGIKNKSLPIVINNLDSVRRLQGKVKVFRRRRFMPVIGWKIANDYFDMIKEKSKILHKRMKPFKFFYYFDESNVEKKYFYGLRDLLDSAAILVMTFAEIIRCKIKSKDAFYLTETFKRKALTRKENIVITAQPSYHNNGHAHISLTLKGNDGHPIRLAFDPATHALNRIYKNRAVGGTYRNNSELILISHAHFDHFQGIKYLLKRAFFSPLKVLVRMLPISRNFINRVYPGEKRINRKLVTPWGSEQIVPGLKYINQYPASDMLPVGVPAFAFDPLKVFRKSSNTYTSVMTIIPVITRHWTGRIPLMDNHKAPALSYIVKSGEQTVYFTGDTAFSHELYQAVAEIMIVINSHFVDVLFTPAGPDFDRKYMENSHQSTIDILVAHFYLQVLPFLQHKKKFQQFDDKKELIHHLGKNTECVFIHHGHYKLGNVHAEDPWVCMMDLIHTLRSDRSCYANTAEGAWSDGSSRLEKWMHSYTYINNKQSVIKQITAFEQQICSMGLDWDRQDTLVVALKMLLSQAEPLQTIYLNACAHKNLIVCLQESITADRFNFPLLSLTNFSRWYFTAPEQRDKAFFCECFIMG